MNFEWDSAKSQSNFDKHGIRLEETAQIFLGPTLTSIDDRQDYGEIREISIGQLRGLAILVVVHTDRDGVIRLISARRAKAREREKYDDHYQKITR